MNESRQKKRQPSPEANYEEPLQSLLSKGWPCLEFRDDGSSPMAMYSPLLDLRIMQYDDCSLGQQSMKELVGMAAMEVTCGLSSQAENNKNLTPEPDETQRI
jgi:hypothetical protein